MFEKILTWSKLTLKQKFNFLMGLQLMVLGWVIIALWGVIGDKQREKNEIRVQWAESDAAFEAKLEFCNRQLFLYVQENEKELRRILFETKQLKENQNENN